MEIDTKQLLREILGLDGDLELDDRALEGLQGMLKSRGGIDFLKKAVESEPESDNEDLAAEEANKNAKIKALGHGLTSVCKIFTKGTSEEILKLTEVFLPKPDDHIIKQKMQKYNSVRMPNIKDIIDPDPNEI
jgi:hypothetical protein